MMIHLDVFVVKEGETRAVECGEKMQAHKHNKITAQKKRNVNTIHNNTHATLCRSNEEYQEAI